MNGEIALNFWMNYERTTGAPVVEYGAWPFQVKATIGLVALPLASDV